MANLLDPLVGLITSFCSIFNDKEVTVGVEIEEEADIEEDEECTKIRAPNACILLHY